MKYCQMTMETWSFKANYFKCGKPAKYITPKEPLSGKRIFVCGIHKNSVDAFHKRINSNEKCTSIMESRGE